MFDAESLGHLFKDGAGAVVVHERKAFVTTEGDEVIVPGGLISLEAAGHSGIVS